ncbi:SPFH domain-containing protein [Methylovirgula sp. 4M-Z18]|uniref:SPFH domain-containing protein n=1 Tax=Methylovirgula sp. 4M-Z18 TaxID=2293567 RepID=UPI000E2E9697|nr:SPFH domain-containing protein [Methylovirgula sp. 4M-Z18]RFB80681.1 flotillin family protein [Methylovirgula sp. 4M-Z18]
MTDFFTSYFADNNAWLIKFAVVIVAILIFFRFSGMVRYISNDRIGILEKLWSFRGSLRSGFIALRGEAGFQPDIVRGGLHVFFPFQYRIHRAALVTIPQGQIAYVFARDGGALPPTQTLASNETAQNFQDVRAFLSTGGQKGPQRKILREGTYALNLAQFIVITAETTHAISLSRSESEMFSKMSETIAARNGFRAVVIKDAEDTIGIVTVHDGPALPEGEIIAPAVGNEARSANFHNNFQDPEAFFKAGGFRGRQHQVLVEGSYYINRLFATVELVPKTVIEVGTVGVVVSYTGKVGIDVSGDNYRHGELVEPGQRGVWDRPLLPGKYAFNTYAGKIISVPTTNFVLKWQSAEAGAHRLDENLAEVSLITRDAFEPLLPLSVVVHIDYLKAPLVVQRFGDIKKLVEQTLDPMVSAYFKNIGQTKTLIQLLQERNEIQKVAGEDMRAKFAAYSLEMQEVLIGTPRADTGQAGIEQILTQLRDRQVAVEKVETYRLQEIAATQERTLREKQAMAEQQAQITASALAIQVRENEGKAQLAQTRQQSESIQVTAQANAARARLEGQGEGDRIRAVGLADAEKIRAIGLAQAEATDKQVQAYGGPQYQLNSQVLLRFAEAIENGKLPVVPNIMVGGGSGGASGSLVEMMLAMLVADRTGQPNPNRDRPGA